MKFPSALVASTLVLSACASIEPQPPADQAGDAYELRFERITESSGSDSSRGSSQSRSTIVERVIAVREDGVELEFDFPAETSAEDRARNWQLPARVRWSPGRPLELLNVAELESRIQEWLKFAELPEEACGRWYFTWNAFKVECDPYSVLELVEAYNIRRDGMWEGAAFRDVGALEAVPLQSVSRSPDREVFVAEMAVDPEFVRRERAEGDVVVAEIVGDEPLDFETALQTWTDRPVSGTIRTEIETNAEGRVVKRTQVVDVDVTFEDGSTDNETTTTTIKRTRIAGSEG